MPRTGLKTLISPDPDPAERYLNQMFPCPFIPLTFCPPRSLPRRTSIQMSPWLPFELIEEIIIEASRASHPESSTLSSLALTSHAFRIIANKRRFQSLYPGPRLYQDYSQEHITTRIRSFSGLIGKGHSITTMPGVCEFATSFSLVYSPYIPSPTGHWSLANVFKIVFGTTIVLPPIVEQCLAYIYSTIYSDPPLYSLCPPTAVFP